MLFTRCPGCQTTFRIAADTLRAASGAVRCGSCATVFSAYSGLRQDALDEGMRQDDEFLSPTLQTQELAGIEDIASPDVTEPDEDAQPSVSAGDEDGGELIVRETLAEDLASEPDEDLEPDDDLSSEPPVAPQSAGALEFAATAEPPREPEAEAEDAVSEASGGLPFEAPVDEWAQLLGEIEQSVSAAAPETDEAAAQQTDGDGASPGAAPAGGEPKEPEFRDVSEPFSLASWDTGERQAPHRATEQREVADNPDLAARAADERDADLATEFVISAEQIDATLSADPDSDLLTALEASLGQLPPSDHASRLWSFGVAALALVLAMQAVHHYRASLASRPVIGGAIQTAYGLLGLEILPAWDLEQYEITNWAATAGPGDSGTGNLHITAQIRNSGPKAQPYPSIQLELKDRWEAVIGSRVFRPREYLAQGFDAGGLMAAGATVPADLAVVDPGLDASSFELDVCLETEAARVSCAADRVFQ